MGYCFIGACRYLCTNKLCWCLSTLFITGHKYLPQEKQSIKIAMIKKKIGLLVALVLYISSHLFAQKTELPVSDFKTGIMVPGVQVLDVRTQSEYNRGHLQNALLADWTDPASFAERIKSLEKDKPVYAYCFSGARSGAAATWLRKQGFKEVYNMQGGILAWTNAQYPVESVGQVPMLTMEEYLASIPSDKTVLVDFGAVWCPPCRKMEPIIDEITREETAGIKVMKIDAGTQEKLVSTLKVIELPTFIIYKNGKETWRQTGIVTKEGLIQQLR